MQVANASLVRLVPNLPGWVPAPQQAAVVSGVLLSVIGGTIAIGFRIRWAAVALVTLLLAGFAFRLPELAANSGALANPAKILALAGGALLAGFPGNKSAGIAAALFALFFLICGWAHFQYSGFVDGLVPGWIPPGRRFWTYFSAVALLAGGAGTVLPPTRRLAGLLSGLMIFLWVLLLHIPRSIELKSAFELAGVFEALALGGVAWLVAASHAPVRPESTKD
ncbi:MAG TPA: hypothetical protein VG734_27360 [Lacunisphaera sp.]|nr:hypothetical protein [Lacunisphaera sp.]